MCRGLRCDRLVPKKDAKWVSDGLGEREEEEKVFRRWPKVGQTVGKRTGRVLVSGECRRWSMSPIVDLDVR